jgi:hypothetical protein
LSDFDVQRIRPHDSGPELLCNLGGDRLRIADASRDTNRQMDRQTDTFASIIISCMLYTLHGIAMREKKNTEKNALSEKEFLRRSR